MRVKIGLTGLLGFGLSVTAALGQGPTQRSVRLLPPRPAEADEVPLYARAAAEPLPPFPQTTPVKQPLRPGTPTWLNDPNVRPASGTATNQPPPRTPTTLPNNGVPREEPSFVAKSFDKIKGVFSSDRPEKPNTPSPTPQPGANQASADTPFRSTTPNGQPIYAGPPAYRWYGWGSVTPGANPYAPTGFSPRASAAWYSITGATPGAFPVAVAEQQKTPGTDPPAYVPAPQARTGPVPAPTMLPASVNYSPPMPAPVRHTGPATHPTTRATAPGMPNTPHPGMPPVENRFPPMPTMTPLPSPTVPSVGAALPVGPVVNPVAIPTITPPPAAGIAASPAPIPTVEPEQPGTRVVSAPFTLAPMLPSPGAHAATVPSLPGQPDGVTTAPAALAPEVKSTAMPAPLPVSVTEEQPKWQPNTGGAAPLPVENWKQPGATDATRLRDVARGQIADERLNPVETLIRRVCEGRASAVELRWTGSNRLAVMFTCRNAADAQKLANDISARPELAAYRIDFSAQLK